MKFPRKLRTAWRGYFSQPAPRRKLLREAARNLLTARLAIAIVGRVAGVSPVSLVCLPRALAAGWMLRRRGVSGRLHFGARRDEHGVISTHAWCEVSGQEVTGYPEADQCVPLGYFTW
jgi:hypothetical protein